jgi:hypothetical protein
MPRACPSTTVQLGCRQVTSTGLYLSMLRFSLANRPVVYFFHSGSSFFTPLASLMSSSTISPDSIIASLSRSILSRSVAEKLSHASRCACSLLVISLLALNRMRSSIVLTSRTVIGAAAGVNRVAGTWRLRVEVHNVGNWARSLLTRGEMSMCGLTKFDSGEAVGLA